MPVSTVAFRRAAVPLTASFAVSLLAMLAAPANAQLIERKDLSFPMALTIAQGALEDCKARGYATSVVVVDRDGVTMVVLRGDGAGPHTVENARRKAYTALTFKATSEDFARRWRTIRCAASRRLCRA